MTVDFRVAAKAFIVENNKLLVVKRNKENVQKPGIWELRGGRLEPGENPFEGLQREVWEETGLEITISELLSVRHFSRADNQTITMIVFLCSLKTKTVLLGKEHDAFQWIALENARDTVTTFYFPELEIY